MSIRKGDDVIAGASVGFVRKPAWDKAVDISEADLYAGYTVPSDGIIVGHFFATNSSGLKPLTVNNVEVAVSLNTDGRWVSGCNCQVQVNKGDVVKIGKPSNDIRFSFVPFEYSGVSDVEVVTPEYIRNQNILSDYEDITISTDSANPNVMRYDGFIYVSTGRRVVLYINTTDFFISDHSNIAGGGSCVLAIRKGDRVYMQLDSGNVTGRVAYYKLRDYTGR